MPRVLKVNQSNPLGEKKGPNIGMKFSFLSLILTKNLTSESYVMLCNVSEPEKVLKQYGCAKVGLNYLLLLDIDNIC